MVQVIFHASSDWLKAFTSFYFMFLSILFLILLITFFMHCKNLIFSRQHWIIMDWTLLFFFQCSHSCLMTRVTSIKYLSKLTSVFFCNFFTPIFFPWFQHSILILLKIKFFYFIFYMFFMKISQPHNLDHKFVVLTWIWWRFFFFIFLFPFALRSKLNSQNFLLL